MRIVYVSQAGALGGGERSLLDLMASVKGALPTADLHLLAGAEGPLAEQAAAMGAQVTFARLPETLSGLGDSLLKSRGGIHRMTGLAARCFLGGQAAFRHVRLLSRMLESIDPSLIHSNDGKSHLLASLAAPRGVPLVWHLRDFVGSRPLLRHALRWTPRRARACIAISEAVARDARVALPWAVTHTFLNCVDLQTFHPGEGDAGWLDALSGKLPLPAGTVRVGLVGTYARWKGHLVYLKAASLAMREVKDVAAFYVVGGPIYRTLGSQFTRAELDGLAGELGLSERVRFVDHQDDVARVYRSLDIVVHASTEPEPFGRTIAEGMACGRSVIASPAGGASELFDDNVDGVAVLPGDADRLARAIVSLVFDPARRQRLATTASLSARQRFSRERLGRQVAGLYAKLTDERAP